MNSKNTYKTFGNLIRSFIPLVMLFPAPIFAAANVEPKCTVDVIAPDFLCINKDDDHKTEKWDKDDPTPFMMADDDLKSGSVTFSVPGDFSGTLTVTFKEGGDKVGGKAWEDAKKTKVHVLKWKIKDGAVEEGEPPLTFFLEGVKHSDKVDDVVMKAVLAGTVGGGGEGEGDGEESESKPCGSEDESETTVYEVDADVDSSNDSQFNFAFTDAEDKIEASEKMDSSGKKKPGKYIFVNAGFSANDNEAAPGWADGFEVGGATSNPLDAKFTPLQIELKKPFDPAKAKIKVEYSAADPASVTRAAGGGTPTDAYTYMLGASGKHLRVWKKDFTTTRDKKAVDAGGDYVLDAKEIEWSKVASGRIAKLYLEAVRPSAALGDLKIEVIITQDGAECRDKVNVTSVYFKDEKIDLSTAVTDYAVAASSYSGVGGNTMDYESEAKFVPNDVDCSKFPLSQYKIGIMQNVLLDDTDNFFDKPVVSWKPGVPAGTTIIFPKERFESILVNTRMNDSIQSVSPLYDQPGSGDTIDANSLMPPIGCPGGGKATTNDSPCRYAGNLTLEYKENGVTVADITYGFKQVTFKLDFVAWCAGYNQATEMFYPLAEREWNMDMDSNKSAPANPQIPTIKAQKSVSIIPVRTPYSNDPLNGALFKTEGPVPGVGNDTAVKP